MNDGKLSNEVQSTAVLLDAAAAGRSMLPSWRDFVAGTASGAAICLVGHPFDTVKVRLQTQAMLPPSKGEAPFRGGWDCLVRTIAKEGPLAVYKGMGGPLATVPLVNAVVFASYEQGRRYLALREGVSSVDDLSMVGVSVAGGWAGLVNSFVVGPVELVKSRLQVQYDARGAKRTISGPVEVLRRLYQARGVRGPFMGMNVTILREVPGIMAQFYVYEWLKRQMAPEDGTTADLGAGPLMLAGGLAGMAAWLASYPQDVIKSRIQVQPDTGPPRYPPRFLRLDGGMVAASREIYREAGWRGFFLGFGPCMLRSMPANAAGFLVYEMVTKMMRESEEYKEGH